ncbi:nucleosome assembly 1-like 1-B isoform X2 [Brachionus plicatilis]|uniref:Nucleosome assembly 1-like 1-B isoform X2 n=1 Tax=Brachionus plicatilis TaxID=10195 RepID=A0A3M7SWD8_BRAPC|nr:nucleosome assembly 1-like 1-B isoform X2 [Brachionus plicatilis]
MRKRIIVGDYEPSDEDCQTVRIGENGDGQEVFKSLNEEIERDREMSKDLLAMSISNYAAKKGDFVKGIPEFWLSVLKRVGLISQMIEPHDEPILKYLNEIDVDLQDKKPYNFSLKFYFYPNEYFHNEVLTKTYEFKIELDSSDPYVFEAPETICSRGCKINWKRNKNVTRKSIAFDSSKDPDDKQMSFFNFFETAEFENKSGNRLTCEEEAEILKLLQNLKLSNLNITYPLIIADKFKEKNTTAQIS